MIPKIKRILRILLNKKPGSEFVSVPAFPGERERFLKILNKGK